MQGFGSQGDSGGRPVLPPLPERTLRVLLVLYGLNYLRFLDPVVRLLLERGHHVDLLLERDRGGSRAHAWLDEMSKAPRFSYSLTDALARDHWWTIGGMLRRASDYVDFLAPEFRSTPFLVDRAAKRAPPWTLRLMALPAMKTKLAHRYVRATLATLEKAIPSSRTLETELVSHKPDVLVVFPHLMPGARHSEYVKSARSLRLPSCLCIASWDNLSSKQKIREIPDRVVVWNDVQRREAEELHGIPSRRVVTTGAQSFDDWFSRQPRERTEFCKRVGLDPALPFLLYTGGSLFPGTLTEAQWVFEQWIPEIRREPELAELSVLIRPHPHRHQEWAAHGFDGLEHVVLWPRADAQFPVDEDSRADYFDSIFHSVAMVGLNTTAMIEAAVIGRPVHTILVPEFATSQTGTFHFDYLMQVGGGLPRVASSFDEHRSQLVQTVRGLDGAADERRRRFLSEFVRPHGLDIPATPLVVKTIEELAAARSVRAPARALVPYLLRLSLGGLLLVRRLTRQVRHYLQAAAP